MQATRLNLSAASGFALAMVLGACTHAPQLDVTEQPAAAKPSPPVLTDNRVVIMFPSGGASLTHEADQKLDQAARLFRDANPVVMFTTGHSDGSGDEFSNVILSARRAEAVKRGLVDRGLPADRLLIQALGISAPANEADPLAAENRRVVITWRLPQADAQK